MIRATLLATALAGCVTTDDAVHSSKPVIATTISAINETPDAWDGKRVLLQGWLDAEFSLLLVSPVWPTEHSGVTIDSIDLDPQEGQRQPAQFDRQQVAVSGIVSLECARRHEELQGDLLKWADGGFIIVDARIGGALAYCNSVYGPYLKQVLIQPLGTHQ